MSQRKRKSVVQVSFHWQVASSSILILSLACYNTKPTSNFFSKLKDEIKKEEETVYSVTCNICSKVDIYTGRTEQHLDIGKPSE